MELKGTRTDAYTAAAEFDQKRIAAFAEHLDQTVDRRRRYRHQHARALHDIFEDRMRHVTELTDMWLPWGIMDISADTYTEIRLAREPGVLDYDGMSVQLRYVADDGTSSEPFLLFALRCNPSNIYYAVTHEMIMDEDFTFQNLGRIPSNQFHALDLDTIREFYETHADNLAPTDH